MTLSNIFTGTIITLPSWAITWPAGQLSSIGRSCNYAQNIKRYNEVFLKAFGGEHIKAYKILTPNNTSKEISQIEAQNQIGLVHIIPLECQSDRRALITAIRPVLEQCVQRGIYCRKLPYTYVMSAMADSISRRCKSIELTRRNASTSSSYTERAPSRKDIALLNKYFEKEMDWYASHSGITASDR
mmetsp:Transcript_40157/g.85491  ORF Transcript_40157/g.85491 Transcript_40157/m.85491 type:complete len:186 (+) Transcript_40157:588-1145(+)